MARTRTWIVFAIAASLVASAVLVQRWWHNRPPYAATALHASAELHPVTEDQAQALLGPTVNAPRIGAGDQLIAGTVRWRKAPTSTGNLLLYLIDEGKHRKPPFIGVDPLRASLGTSSVDTKVANRYPWLQGAGMVYKDGSWWESGEELEVAMSSGVTSVTFVAVFPSADSRDRNRDLYATTPVDVSRLLVGVVLTGDDDQIYWAQRLHG
ncbi:hypothetical protein [Rugosimonospora africana]|uniref:Uncharacterized protein n=1 Tax=Rugosimonospora africana TaxID=556532 RepID=A0A8J3VUH8_9ACTN|nr:hypothetical protein [Rugosimonospora africana]GIH19557.1 hypothetical protein Raf01_77290 [Rugosimonospora africana]